MVGGIGVIGGIGFGFSGLLGRFFRELVPCFADPWGYCFDLLGGLWGNLGPWRGILRAREGGSANRMLPEAQFLHLRGRPPQEPNARELGM